MTSSPVGEIWRAFAASATLAAEQASLGLADQKSVPTSVENPPGIGEAWRAALAITAR